MKNLLISLFLLFPAFIFGQGFLEKTTLDGSERLRLYDEQGGNKHITLNSIKTFVGSGGGTIGGTLINNGDSTYTWTGSNGSYIINNKNGYFVESPDTTYTWITPTGDSLFTFQPCSTCGAGGNDFEILGTGTVFVKDDNVQVGRLRDTVNGTEYDLYYNHDVFNPDHRHLISRSGETGGWSLDENGFRVHGSIIYRDSYRDTVLVSGNSYFDSRLGNSRAVYIDNIDTEIDIRNLTGFPGQEFIVFNAGEEDIILQGPTTNGFIGGNRGVNYILPPTTNATIRIGTGNDGNGRDIIAGTGYWLRSPDIVLRPDEGNIGIFPASVAELSTGSFCKEQTYMGAATGGGSTIHSIENCGDGYIGILQNNSSSDNIILPANSAAGTGVRWAPGSNYILPPGRAVMYRVNNSTRFAHILSNN